MPFDDLASIISYNGYGWNLGEIIKQVLTRKKLTLQDKLLLNRIRAKDSKLVIEILLNELKNTRK